MDTWRCRVGIRRCRSEVSKQWVSGGAEGKQWVFGGAGAKLWTSGGAGGKLWMSGGAGGKLWVSGGAGGRLIASGGAAKSIVMILSDRSWFHSWFLHSCFHRYPDYATIPLNGFSN